MFKILLRLFLFRLERNSVQISLLPHYKQATACFYMSVFRVNISRAIQVRETGERDLMFSFLYRDVAGPSEMLRRSPSTMNLFPVSEKPGHISCQNMGAPRNFTSMDLFPQQAGFAPKEDVPMKLDSRCVWIYYLFYPWT